ncbi:Gibberellin 20 oxidase 3 [Platanthera guangdongensis]|uniref:Gibberellin 20 oxidase 3 n=1 Tax=Platanthera guangdongensis TaxID=2320717 RepID=A0ABR2MYL5_9ASPA
MPPLSTGYVSPSFSIFSSFASLLCDFARFSCYRHQQARCLAGIWPQSTHASAGGSPFTLLLTPASTFRLSFRLFSVSDLRNPFIAISAARALSACRRHISILIQVLPNLSAQLLHLRLLLPLFFLPQLIHLLFRCAAVTMNSRELLSYKSFVQMLVVMTLLLVVLQPPATAINSCMEILVIHISRRQCRRRAERMAGSLQLPLVDLCSGDRAAAARSIRQACLDHGFFYLTNHGIDGELHRQVFRETEKFFSLPLDEKLKLEDTVDHYGYIPPHAEIVDPSKPKGFNSFSLINPR